MNGYVLIVDDDADIRNMLGIYLENEGLNYIKCENAAEAIDLMQDYKVDLILLDIMMPGIDGIEACIRIRELSRVPIIFMSAKVGDMDKIHGLTVGADDYITKPFNPLELVTRVKAQLRRYNQYGNNEVCETYQHKELMVNNKTRQVWIKGKEIRLTPKEYDILLLLIQNKGITLSVKRIYEKVWREEYMQNESTVLVHISNLRDKLEKDSQEYAYVKTVWGVGYKI
jgi:two-component system response regulator VanR